MDTYEKYLEQKQNEISPYNFFKKHPELYSKIKQETLKKKPKIKIRPFNEDDVYWYEHSGMLSHLVDDNCPYDLV